MKVLFVSHIWPPAIDGGSQILANCQKQLKKIGHSTLTLTTNCTSTDDFINPSSKTINTTSKTIIRLPIFKTKLFVYSKKFLNKFLNLESDLLNLVSVGPIFRPFPLLKSIIKIIRFKPDLIMAGPFPTTIYSYALFFKKITNSKLLILPCFHQYESSFQNKILINHLKKADYIWTLTRHEKTYLKNNLSTSTTKIFTLYPGISDTFLKPIKQKTSHKTINLLFLGNLAAHKKIKLLLSSFEKINRIYPQTRLTIVGQTTLYYPQIRKHLKTIPKHVKKHIRVITKKYTPSQAKQHLNQADIFINPSVHESFGLVFLEAMSQGIPVVGSNIPPVAEIIKTSKAGLIFKKNNLDDLVSKITKLIKNQKLANNLSSNGIKFTKLRNWSQVTKKLMNEI